MIPRIFPDKSVYLDDGSYEVPEINQSGFHENLVRYIPLYDLKTIGRKILRSIKDDYGTMEKYLEDVATIIDLMGLYPKSQTANNSQYSKKPFSNSSDAVSTALTMSLYGLLSDINEIFVSLSSVIYGTANDSNIESIASAKVEFFKKFLNEIQEDYYIETYKTNMWTTLTGSGFKKVYYDSFLKRPNVSFIPNDQMIVDLESNSYHKPKTQILYLTKEDLRDRIRTGMYLIQQASSIRSVESVEDSELYAQTLNENLNKTISVDNSPRETQDRKYVLYESHRIESITIDPFTKGEAAPYIVTLCSETGNIVGIYRNWKKNDPERKEIPYFIEYNALPALKGNGYGLIQYAGVLAAEATKLKRQIINATTYANFPAYLYAAGTRLSETILQLEPFSLTPIETGGRSLNESIKEISGTDPTPTMIEVQKSLEEEIKTISSAMSDKIIDAAQNSTASVLVPMIEAKQKIPNALLKNFFNGFTRELTVINDRFKDWFSIIGPKEFEIENGAMLLKPEDFKYNIKIVPSADPTFYNKTLRFVRADFLLGKAKEAPEIHNMIEAYEMFYKNLGMSEDQIDLILNKPKEPEPLKPMDPVTENSRLMTGAPVQAFLDQDHDAHMAVHGYIMEDKTQPPNVKQATMAHIQEHKALKFQKMFLQETGLPLPPEGQEISMNLQNLIAQKAAQAISKLPKPPEEQQPPQQMDPTIALLKEVAVKEKEVAVKEKLGIQKNKIDLLKVHQKEREMANKAMESQRKATIDEKNLLLNTEKVAQKTITDEEIIKLRNKELEMRTEDSIEKNALAEAKARLGK